jgi:SAM-dependent methyltransferase
MTIKDKLRITQVNAEIFGFWTTFKMSLLYILSTFLAKPSKDKFDKKHGVSTSGNLTLDELGIDDPYSVLYVPTHERVMNHVLKNLDINYQDYTFVDLGCGKGRAVLMAMKFPFKEVIGVELSAQSSTIAKANTEIFNTKGLQQCKNVEIRCENALDFQIPQVNVIFYLYRPFIGPVLEQVLDNISEAGSKSLNRFFIAYSSVSPDVRRLIESKASFVKIKEYNTINGEYSWSLWVYKKPSYA